MLESEGRGERSPISRCCMLKTVPEIGIVLVASQAGLLAVFNLLRDQRQFERVLCYLPLGRRGRLIGFDTRVIGSGVCLVYMMFSGGVGELYRLEREDEKFSINCI
jgi:hypothetical protein